MAGIGVCLGENVEGELTYYREVFRYAADVEHIAESIGQMQIADQKRTT